MQGVISTDDLYNELMELREGGADHYCISDHATSSAHRGFDMSEDRTMVVVFTSDGVVIVSPYRLVRKAYNERS